MQAPVGATALLSVFGRIDGVNEITYVCKDGSRKMVLEVTQEIGLLDRMWIELDTTMDTLMDAASTASRDDKQIVERLRIRARAQAEMLAMLMSPYFTNADEIAGEAKRRWDARGKNVAYETPGLGSRRFEPPQQWRDPQSYAATNALGDTPRSSSPRRTTATKSQTAAPKPPKQIPADQVATVKQSLDMGMFKLADIAKMYKMSEEQVKSQLGLA